MSGKISYTNGGFSSNDPKVEAHVVEQLPEQKPKDETKWVRIFSLWFIELVLSNDPEVTNYNGV